MKISEIVSKLNVKVVVASDLDREISGGFTGDLLSVVMGKAKEGQVWITIQSHLNIVAVASLVNVACIIVSEGFEVDADAIEKAREEGVTILTTNKSSYDIIKDLINLGV